MFIHGCFVTLTEVEYITAQEHGMDAAVKAMTKLAAWPVQWHHSDDALCSAAAKLKAAHKISFADCFVAALAQRLNVTLVHKDPEFVALGGVVKQRVLPLKTTPTT